MYGDASGDIGDLAGNFSDSGGAAPGGFDPSAALDAFADANLSGFNTAANLANAVAAAEASGLHAGPYSRDVAQAIADMMSSPLGEGAASGRGFHSPGLSYGTLAALEQSGFGKTDIPGFSQNVEQALAARNVQDILGYVAPAIASMVPGYGTVSALGKGIAGIHGLMTGRLTAEQVIPGLAAGAISAKTGIPSGILEGLFEGNLGKAAGSGVQAGITSGLGPLGGLAFNLSGAGSAVNRGVSDAVSGATGGAQSGGLGSFSGAGPAPSTSMAPTGNTYGDSATESISATLAAIEQAAQQPQQPAWAQQMVAGRYGPLVQYDYGA